jgi:hypothetical protein
VTAVPPGVPSTLQLTLKFVVLPVTVPVNCCVWVVAATAAMPGEMLTTIVATVRLSAVVCVKLPDVPVTITADVPVVAELLALSVKVLAPVAGSGLNDAVTPAGSVDVTARFTLPVKPFVGFIVMVLVLLLV